MSIPKTAYFVYGEHKTNPMPDTGFANMADFVRLNNGCQSRFITMYDYK